MRLESGIQRAEIVAAEVQVRNKRVQPTISCVDRAQSALTAAASEMPHNKPAACVCVQAAQAALLGAARAQQLAVERMVYSNMAAQADADARAKVRDGNRLKAGLWREHRGPP
jgi:hypothetical protein